MVTITRKLEIPEDRTVVIKLPDTVPPGPPPPLVANAVLLSNDGKLARIPNLQLRAVPLKS